MERTVFHVFLFIGGCIITGEEIVAGDDMYGGSDRLLSQVIPKTGVVVKLVLLSLSHTHTQRLFL